MEKRGLFLCFIFILLVGVSAAQDYNLFFNGGFNIVLDGNYESGQNIEIKAHIYNNENFPIVNASLVVELVRGCEYPTYPSQDSDCDSVIDEIVISGIYITPKGSIDIPFNYSIPSNLKSGQYRFDFFLMTDKTPISGLPHIFIVGDSKAFRLNSSSEMRPVSSILRTKTNLNGDLGPIGTPLNPQEKGKLEVYLNSSEDYDGELKILICEWHDSICNNGLSVSKSVKVTKGEQKIEVELTAPSEPGAYSVRIELLRDGKLESLYRSRIITKGETAKIRKLYTNKYYYDNENVKVGMLLAGSPDHYSWEYTGKTIASILIKNKESGKEYKKEFSIDNFTKENFFLFKEVEFKVEEIMKKFEVCLELKSGVSGKTYDKYCYEVDFSLFKDKRIEIELKEKYEKDKFVGSVCLKNSLNMPVKSNVEVFVTSDGKLIKKFISFSECVDLDFEMIRDKIYRINVQDLDNHISKSFEVSLKSKEASSKIVIFSIVILVIIILLIVSYLVYRRLKK